MQQQARRRAAALGVSFAEYIRRLVRQDIGAPRPPSDPTLVFDLGDSGGSDISQHRREMTAKAFAKGRGLPE